MKKLKTIADQNARMHLIGRLWLIGGMLLICTIPLWLSLYYDVEPMWEVFGSAAVISPFILMALSGIAEPIVYSPMVGIPQDPVRRQSAGDRGHQERHRRGRDRRHHRRRDELPRHHPHHRHHRALPRGHPQPYANDRRCEISHPRLRVRGVRAVRFPRRQVYRQSLGGKYIVKNPKLAIGPIIIVVIVSIVLGVVGMDPGSAYLFVGIAVCLVFAIWQMLREKKKLRERDELRRLEAIASGMSYEKVVAIETAQYYDAHPEKKPAEETAAEIEEKAVAEAVNEVIEEAIETSKEDN